MDGARPTRRLTLRAVVAMAALVAVLAGVGVALATSGSTPPQRTDAASTTHPAAPVTARVTTQSAPATASAPAPRSPARTARPPVVTTVRVLTLHITDPTRTMATPQ